MAMKQGQPIRKELIAVDKIKTPFRLFIAALFVAVLTLSPLLNLRASAVETDGSTVVNHPVWLATITVDNINVRDEPSLSGTVVSVLGYGNVTYLTGVTVTNDGYTWWETVEGNYIAETGGWTKERVYRDYTTCYDEYGGVAWTHTCTYFEETYFHYVVTSSGYTVTCDCGWTTERTATIHTDSDGNVIAKFIGLDTDGNEIVDLYPGQIAHVLHPGINDFIDVTVYEMYDAPDRDVPTVTIWLHDREYNTIATYTFEWYVDVSIESYGVKMVGMDGTIVIHPLSEDDYILYCDYHEYYLGDLPTRYFPSDVTGEDSERHYTYGFILSLAGDSSSDGQNIFERLFHHTRKFCGNIAFLFEDFFNFRRIFSEDSPFKFLIQGIPKGVQEAFTFVRTFFECLPSEVMYGATFFLLGVLILGFLRWFR